MGIVLSIGRGVKNPQAERVDIGDDLVSALAALPADEERWWSGHLWTHNRRAHRNWEGATVVVLDVDHYDSNGEHAAPPPDRRDVLAAGLSTLPDLSTAWHLTPRGLRLAWALSEFSSDAGIVQHAYQGAAALVAEALSAFGVAAVRQRDGTPRDGYAVDSKASFDRARLVYAPRALVDGTRRSDDICRGRTEAWALAELLGAYELAPASDAIDDEVPLGLADDHDIADVLAKMPSVGENDGSLELIRVCRRAIGLGVEDENRFIAVARRWNETRLRANQPLWTHDDMRRRFTDALARWESEGMARVPIGRYTVAALHTIVREDRAFRDRLAWDVTEQAILTDDTTMRDEHFTAARETICRRYGYPTVPKDDLRDALQLAARAREVDRVSDYLAGIAYWDGVCRFSELVRRMHIVSPAPWLAEAYLRKTLVAAVARRVEPGCKHDHMLVLVGPDRMRKSSFFRVLAGDDNFADTAIDLNSKDGYMQVTGSWIYEWGELEAITRKSDVARIKSFISSQVDRYRAPYARGIEAHPRRGIFVGSSNSGEIIYDMDSDRRWWICELQREPRVSIDLDWVALHRDQLWAEALDAYASTPRSEHPWWLDEVQELERERVNEAYKPEDLIEDAVILALSVMQKQTDFNGSFLTADLYRKMGLDPTQIAGPIRTQVSGVLKRLGASKTRVGETKRKGWILKGS